MIDIHTHILPKLDDGPDDWDTSVKMCKMAHNDGIQKIVLTPHKDDVYDNDKNSITSYAKELSEKTDNIVEFYTGADVLLTSTLLDQIRKGEIPTINDKSYMLLELPHNQVTINMEKVIFNLHLEGYYPILTHPERNGFLQNHINVIKNLINMGLYVQITAMSLTGGFGKGAMKCSEAMLKAGLVHNIASDAHSLKARPPILSRAFQKAKKIVGERTAKMMVLDIPQKIVDGEPIDTSELKEIKKRWFFF